MAALWRLVEHVWRGPLGMFILQSTAFVAGAYLLLRRWMGPFAAAIATVLIAWFPPVSSTLAVIWKDSQMLGYATLGVALLARGTRRAQLAGLAALALASAMRHNAFTLTCAPIVLLFAWPGLARWRRYAVAAGAWLGITALAFGVNAALTDEHKHPWTDAGQIWDVCGMIADAPPMSDDELAGLLAGTPFKVSTDIQRTIADAYDPAAGLYHVWDQHILDQVSDDAQRAAVDHAWWTLLGEHPGAYLEHRAAMFAQVMAPGRRQNIWVGIDSIGKDLYRDHPTPMQRRLRKWQLWTGDTWLFWPWLYLAGADGARRGRGAAARARADRGGGVGGDVGAAAVRDRAGAGLPVLGVARRDDAGVRVRGRGDDGHDDPRNARTISSRTTSASFAPPGGMVATGECGAGAHATTGLRRSRRRRPCRRRAGPRSRPRDRRRGRCRPSRARRAAAGSRTSGSGSTPPSGAAASAIFARCSTSSRRSSACLAVLAPRDHAVVAEQHGVDELAPRRERGARGVAGLRVRQLRDLRAERDQRLGDERLLDRVAARARDRGRVRRVRVDDRADVGPALVDDEVQADLAEHLAARRSTWPLASTSIRSRSPISRFEVAVGVAMKRAAVARGDVAVVVRDPAGGVQERATSRRPAARELPHVSEVHVRRRCRRSSSGSARCRPAARIWRTPLPSVSTITLSPTPACDVVDRDEARAGVLAVLVERLDDEQRLAGERRVLDRGPHRPDDAAALHRGAPRTSTPSTMPTIAASTGTNHGSSASAASREPTR